MKRVVLKSQDEFYLGLHTQLIRSDPLELSSSMKKLAFTKDVETLRSRFHSESLAFLTKSLPKLGKALDQGLVSGRFTPVNGFKSAHGRSTPAFMSAYFNLVFDEDGYLLDVVPVEAIKHLRQVLYFSYKLEVPFSKLQNEAVIATFTKVDEELGLQCDPLADYILQLAKIITGKVFHDFNHKDILPKHGPGAVATGERGEDKWVFSRLYNAIHQVYPYYEYFVVGGARELFDRLDWYKSLHHHENGCAKVVLVPKDSRGPRLISCEPLEYQYIQQGLGRKLSRFLEQENSWTRGRINFKLQSINRSLAQTSSASKQYATLDLKDASDRVSLEVVRRIFTNTPLLLRALEACRTTQTRLPNGDVIDLNKFAPMGSALCFPVESYIFWVTVVSAIVHRTNLPWDRVAKLVYVYGDDIIVPTRWASISIQGLECIGLVVNHDKSCITGNFRESCGMDAFKGIDVTPSRLRNLWTGLPSDGSALASYVALANSLASKQYNLASDFLWERIEATYGKMPYGTWNSSFPCRITDSPMVAEMLNASFLPWKVNRIYQRREFLVSFLTSRKKKSRLTGWPRLLRDSLSPPFGDPSVVVLPRSTKIKRGWMSVH